jgi:hypothetical protein
MSIQDALSELIPEDHPMNDLIGKEVMATFFMPLDDVGPMTWFITEDGHAFGCGARGMEPVYCKVEPHQLGQLLIDVENYATALAANAAMSMQSLQAAKAYFSHLFESAGPVAVDPVDVNDDGDEDDEFDNEGPQS